jgi:hypothetical protein
MRAGGACAPRLPQGGDGDHRQRQPLLVRETQEAFRPSVAAQRIEDEAQRAVECQVEPERAAPSERPVLDPRDGAPAAQGDECESRGFVELHRVRRPAVAAAGEETADAADGMAERNGDGEVVGAAREREAARGRERRTGQARADQAAEEHEAHLEIGPEA